MIGRKFPQDVALRLLVQASTESEHGDKAGLMTPGRQLRPIARAEDGGELEHHFIARTRDTLPPVVALDDSE